jgi:hypothetical protein
MDISGACMGICGRMYGYPRMWIVLKPHLYPLYPLSYPLHIHSRFYAQICGYQFFCHSQSQVEYGKKKHHFQVKYMKLNNKPS